MRRLATGSLLVVAGLLAVSAAAQAQTTTSVTIEARHDSIGAGLEDLKFTLTRGGDTTEELVATVTIDQDRSWLGTPDLSHTVTFLAGEATATLTIDAADVSFDPSTTGDLTARARATGPSRAAARRTRMRRRRSPRRRRSAHRRTRPPWGRWWPRTATRTTP